MRYLFTGGFTLIAILSFFGIESIVSRLELRATHDSYGKEPEVLYNIAEYYEALVVSVNSILDAVTTIHLGIAITIGFIIKETNNKINNITGILIAIFLFISIISFGLEMFIRLDLFSLIESTSKNFGDIYILLDLRISTFYWSFIFACAVIINIISEYWAEQKNSSITDDRRWKNEISKRIKDK